MVFGQISPYINIEQKHEITLILKNVYSPLTVRIKAY